VPLITVGVNHKTAPVEIREQIAFAPENVPSALRQLTAFPEVSEAAILSTCNRTELVCCAEKEDAQSIIEWFHRYHNIDASRVNPYIYIHPNQYAVQHLLRVASGLDSLILGEPQILGQLKAAYTTAVRSGSIGTLLGRLFQHTFSVAKQVRTDTAIGSSPVSVAFAAVNLAKQIFSNFSEHTTLLIGAGETIELAARHLHKDGIGNIIVANRTVERAHALANEFGGYAITLAEIPAHLAKADIVISSTASQLPILGKGAVESAIKTRKHRPVLMVDIAVPRDIEPQVGELDDVYLYTVDDLHEIIEENVKSRQEAALQAEEIIEAQVSHFMGWLRSLDAVATIKAYRDNAQRIRDEETRKAQRLLANGTPAEALIEQMARTLTNKLIHAPCVQMRQAGYEGNAELLQVSRELLDIKDSDL